MKTNFQRDYLNFNHVKYFQNKELSTYKNLRKEIRQDIESLDKLLRDSKMRKQKGYVVKGYVSRQIITVFGEVTFKRTKYQHFDSKLNKCRTVCLLDNYIQIEPYQRMNLHLQLEIMEQLATSKRQRVILINLKLLVLLESAFLI